MNAPTQLDPELTRAAARLRSVAPDVGSATRPALADIRRGAHRRRTNRRMLTGAVAVAVLGTVTATTMAVRRDDGSTASTLNDPIDVAIAQTQPLVPKLGPGEKFDYAMVQGGDQPGAVPDQVLVIADHDNPTLFDRSVLAVVVPDPDGTAITGLTGWEAPRNIAGREVAQFIDRSGPQFRWTKNGTSVWLQGRNITVADLETIVGSVTELGASLRVSSNSLSMRVVGERARSASFEFTLTWTMTHAIDLATDSNSTLLERFYPDIPDSATTVRGTQAVVFISNGGLAIAWEEPARTVRTLSAYEPSVTLAQLKSVAQSLAPIGVHELRERLTNEGTTLDSNLFSGATDTANTMSTATTAAAAPVTGNRLGDSASLSSGSVYVVNAEGIRPAGEVVPNGKVTLGLVRTVTGEPWSIALYQTNPAGGCFLTPISGASINGPDAPFFTNECDHSTYTMDGRCLNGCTIGLYATKLDEHDGAIWGDITRFDSRRPKA